MAAPSCWSPRPRAARLCACAATNEGEASVKSRIRRGGGSVGVAALLMLALLPAHSRQKVKKPAAQAAPALPPPPAGQRAKTPAAGAAPAAPGLVWPLPPAAPRIRWAGQITDFNEVKGKAKKKRSWIDRIAGVKEAAEPEARL